MTNEKKYLSWDEIDPDVKAVLIEENKKEINELAVGPKEIIDRCMNESEHILDHLIKSVLFADLQYVNHWKNEIWGAYHLCIRNKISKTGKSKAHYPSVAELTEWLLLSCVNDVSGLEGRILGDAELYSPNPRSKEFEMDYAIGIPYDVRAAAEAIWQYYMKIFEIPQRTDAKDERHMLVDQAFQDIIIPAGQYEVDGRHSQGRR